MNTDDSKQVSAILKQCSLEHVSVERQGLDAFRVEIVRRKWDDATWSYDNIAKAAALLGTTNINFEWESGWSGTDVTPGDPAQFWVLIAPNDTDDD